MIGWLIIGTNKYFDIGLECIESIKENYSGKHDQKFFFFTDRSEKVIPEENLNVIKIEHEKFPYISMSRYRHFHNNSLLLRETDYLFYIDADMKFNDVGDEILEKRVTTLHPGFWNVPSTRCTFDRNPNSNAYVPYEYDGPYFQNCFQGGETDEFLRMSKLLSERLAEDLENGVMPLWHDESHMNRYMSEYKPTKILDPGYAYCQHLENQFNLKENFKPKIFSLDKDHEEIRK